LILIQSLVIQKKCINKLIGDCVTKGIFQGQASSVPALGFCGPNDPKDPDSPCILLSQRLQLREMLSSLHLWKILSRFEVIVSKKLSIEEQLLSACYNQP